MNLNVYPIFIIKKRIKINDTIQYNFTKLNREFRR